MGQEHHAQDVTATAAPRWEWSSPAPNLSKSIFDNVAYGTADQTFKKLLWPICRGKKSRHAARGKEVRITCNKSGPTSNFFLAVKTSKAGSVHCRGIGLVEPEVCRDGNHARRFDPISTRQQKSKELLDKTKALCTIAIVTHKNMPNRPTRPADLYLRFFWTGPGLIEFLPTPQPLHQAERIPGTARTRITGRLGWRFSNFVCGACAENDGAALGQLGNRTIRSCTAAQGRTRLGNGDISNGILTDVKETPGCGGWEALADGTPAVHPVVHSFLGIR